MAKKTIPQILREAAMKLNDIADPGCRCHLGRQSCYAVAGSDLDRNRKALVYYQTFAPDSYWHYYDFEEEYWYHATQEQRTEAYGLRVLMLLLAAEAYEDLKDD